MFKKVPDTLVIIGIILAIFTALTWIIPAGQFDYEQQEYAKVVVPGSYKKLTQSPQGLDAFFVAPVKGFISGAQIIAFILFIGGTFGILHKTGAIEMGLKKIIYISFQRPVLQKMFIPFLMLLFSVAGATFGMSEENLIFVLLTIPIAISLGYDSIVGVAIPFVGSSVGFAGAISNPFTIGVAQGIAEVPLFSGWEYRIWVWLFLTFIGIFFVMLYANKVKKNPEISPVYQLDKTREAVGDYTNKVKLGYQNSFILLSFMVVIVLLVLGVNIWNWHINEISGLFIGLAVISAIIGKLELQEAIDAFTTGAKDLLPASLVVAMSKGILVILTDGKIIDTILFTLSDSVHGFSPIVSAQIMFYIQSMIHVLVPSGSGQAALSMPIMAPLSDLLAISRQTTVLIFQLGDGINSMIIPTSGVTMGILSISKISYQTWIKWIWPLMLCLFLAAMLILIPPVLLFDYQ